MRLAGRSPRELVFRAGQAVANLALWAFPNQSLRNGKPTPLRLPRPDDIRRNLAGSAFEKELLVLANGIMEHRLPLLGTFLDTGPAIEWRRDYIHARTSGTGYFRFVPYLDFSQVGDHKNIWELNRHQHLVVLAQAQLFTGHRAYGNEIERQLASWWEQNPFLRGINWASALEVAFRALSWLWIDHLIGAELGQPLHSRLLQSLHQHGAYLQCNLSTYFSPNTHLLGEGVALHAIGARLNQAHWSEQGARVVEEELGRQVQADGSHFEQSTYYHVYALDFFVMHYLLAGRPKTYEPVLRKMARFLSAVVGPERLLTCFGDDDGGRLFHPYGPRDKFARATLATCAVLFPDEELPLALEDLGTQATWWLATETGTAKPFQARAETRLFPDSGLASIATAGAQVLMDAGPLGAGGAGHSHADTLSITARSGPRDLLIDPGTFTYISDPRLRNEFRGTAFHNTIRIGGLDQAEPKGPFRWEEKPAVEVHHWRTEAERTFLDASCSYRGFTHRRRLLVVANAFFVLLDEITGPAGEHRIEQFWHLGDPEVAILFCDPKATHHEDGMRSRVFGAREPSPVIRVAWQTTLPHLCSAAVAFSNFHAQASLNRSGEEVCIQGVASISFASPGMPVVSLA